MQSENLENGFTTPIHFAWYVIHDLAMNGAPVEAFREAFVRAKTGDQGLGHHKPTISATRRLGFFWPMARASARLRGLTERLILASPVMELFADLIGDLNDVHFAFNGPAEFTVEEAQHLCDRPHLSFGYYNLDHPYPGGVDIEEPEWLGGDCWHWLWILCQSQIRRGQGERAYQALASCPDCRKQVIADGLLTTLAQNYCESQFHPDERFDNEAEYVHCSENAIGFYHVWRISQMGRFCALYVALRQLICSWSHEETCQYLGYPDPQGKIPTNNAIDQTMARMRDWLE